MLWLIAMKDQQVTNDPFLVAPLTETVCPLSKSDKLFFVSSL